MTFRGFSPGDRVRIKTWSQLEAEFGHDGYQDLIPCQFSFLREMELFCGNEYIINEIDGDGEVYFEYTADGIGDYRISVDVIEHVCEESELDEESLPEITIDALLGILDGFPEPA